MRPDRYPPILSFIVLATAIILFGCEKVDDQVDLASTGTMTKEDWIVLFDGSSLDHWRGYLREDVPSAWRIEYGSLAFVPGEGEGGDIITRDQYDDFELELEWKISEGGNSGIFYRVHEDPAFRNTYQTGPEFQVLDDDGHADGLIAEHRAGSNYALHAPSAEALKPVGEWNTVRIVADSAHVEHLLNGELIVEYEQWSDEWQRLVDNSKFVDMPDYGQYHRGHIALQDHGDRVWYRNIRIRPIRN